MIKWQAKAKARQRLPLFSSGLPWAAVLFFSLLLAIPLWGPGLVNTRGGGDSPFLFFRLHQLTINLRAGIFPIRWMPDAAYGLGYPFFNHYAAFPFYLAAVPNLLGVDLLKSLQWVQTCGFLLAPLSFYAWARRHLGRSAWLGALAFGAAPFHLVNVYVRGDSLSEFWAFCFYPLILWALDHCIERPGWTSGVGLGLAFGALILTHNISAMIFSPFMALYLLLRGKTRKQVASAVLGLLLAFALTAWFWLPALVETKYGQLDTVTEGYFHYADHFRGANLLQSSLAFDYAIEGRTPFAMGLVQAILLGLGALLLFADWLRRRRLDAWALFALLGLLVSTLMITPLSRPLWDHLPLLPFVQFPWRFLSVQALFAALLVACGWRGMHERWITSHAQWVWVTGVSLAALLTAAALWSLHPERLHIASDDITSEHLQLYEWFTENIGTTITYEYLPRWTVPRPYTGPALLYPGSPPSILTISGSATGRQLDSMPTRQTWQVSAGEGGARVAFPLLYWPGWHADIDGQPAPLTPVEDLGWAALDLPLGKHQVTLTLGRTRLRAAAESISLLTALIVLASVLYKLRRPPHTWRFAPWGLALVLSTIPLLWPTQNYAPNDLTWDFVERPYLHHNPGGINVAQAQAASYEIESDGVYTVTLHWDDWQAGQAAHVALLPPAAIRRPETAPLAESILPIQAQTTHRLDVPIAFPPGPLLLRLQVAHESVYLQPIWPDFAPDEPPPTQWPSLCSMGVGNARDPWVFDVCLLWGKRNPRPIPANYKISLRLRDQAGFEWGYLDTQPGYGYAPTSLWFPQNHKVADYISIPLADAPPPGDYQLDVVLYRAASLAPVSQSVLPVRLNGVVLQDDFSETLAAFDNLHLKQFIATEQVVEQGAPLLVKAHWWAAESTEPLSVTWSIGNAFSQTSTLPALPAHAFVTTPQYLKPPASLPPGQYQIAVTVGDVGSYIHTTPLEIVGRARQTELPPLQTPVEADFGAALRLWGYDLAREGDALRLTLHWGALTEMDTNYKFFVHLLDPAGSIAAQHDGMPRDYTYPTSLWAAGEVVSDEVTLSLAGLAPGTYRLVVGWYDEANGLRLDIKAADDWRVSEGRLYLDAEVVVE